MKIKYLATTLFTLAFLASCRGNEENSSSSKEENLDPSKDLIAQRLSSLETNRIISFDFIDRSYDFDSYSDSKYVITGDIKKAYVNYEAWHSFNVYNDQFVTDSISVEGYVGVETPVSKTQTEAKGQIFTENGYLYDYLVCDSDSSKSYVNCYETDYFNNFNSYFNYLSIIASAASAFSSPTEYFPEESGYLAPNIEINVNDGVETYKIEGKYEGDDTYRPQIINFEVQYNAKTSSFDKVVFSQRALLNTLDGDFETETGSLRVWTLYNLKMGERSSFNGKKYSFDDIPSKDSIHNPPKTIVDLSNVNDGKIEDDKTLEVIRNIYAYSNGIKQMNYSMYYHDAFDFADSNYKDIGDAIFTGKAISYSNNVLDNVGKIQKVDVNGLPRSDDPAEFRIFTEIVDTPEAKGVLRVGEFDKYITSCLAFASYSSFASSRAYLDANPLYWEEISSILDDFSTYDLGNNVTSSSTRKQLSVSGIKNGNSLTVTGQIHSTTTMTEYIDAFTFEIESNKLMYVKFETKGKNYTDVYETRFVHGAKEEFKGQAINTDDINAQVTMESFRII